MKGPYVLTWIPSIVPYRRVVWRESTTDEPIRFRTVASAQATFDKMWFSTSAPPAETIRSMKIMPLVQWLIEQGR